MATTRHPPLIVICGPTASGKSSLALTLAEQYSGFIISADSRQVYRGMDIGTAKPSVTERRRIPHFLIDVVSPDEPFTVADYQRLVVDVLSREAGLPFLVGGTGLYIDAVVENWEIPHGCSDATHRKKLEHTSMNLFVKRLEEIDPESAAVIDLKNKRRVIRALEVAEQTGKSFIAQKKKWPFPYRVLRIGMDVPREELIGRINTRVDAMMTHGLLDEVRALGRRYGWDAPALSGLGYRQLGAHLRGEMRLGAAVEHIKIATRQYAKRQMTWFKRDQSIQWISDASAAVKLLQTFLANVAQG
ncbi:MAG: tRNA (adenosine(37)-N6)-dimethylallyltransferase MiaA [bacterium]